MHWLYFTLGNKIIDIFICNYIIIYYILSLVYTMGWKNIQALIDIFHEYFDNLYKVYVCNKYI